MNIKKADSGQTFDAARDKESRPTLDTVDSVVLCQDAPRCNPDGLKEGGNFCRHSIPHEPVCRCTHSKACFFARGTMVRCTEHKH
jgi:hypothetical protein